MSNITDVQNVSVPLNGTVPDGVPQFRIRSTVDLSETEIQIIGHSAGPIYLSMAVRMPPGLPDGTTAIRRRERPCAHPGHPSAEYVFPPLQASATTAKKGPGQGSCSGPSTEGGRRKAAVGARTTRAPCE